MSSFIQTGDENDYYNTQNIDTLRTYPVQTNILQEQENRNYNDIQEIKEIREEPIGSVQILIDTQHIEQLDYHYFNIIYDKPIPFKDLIIQRNKIEGLIPFNNEIFTLKRKEQINENLPYEILIFDFKEIEMEMVEKTIEIYNMRLCPEDIYKTCLFYKVINEDINDNYWIVLLKLLKFIPNIIQNQLEKQIYDIIQLERKIRSIEERKLLKDDKIIEGNEKIIDINKENDLYDIQITKIDLNDFSLEGFQCKRNTNIVIPIYFKIIKVNKRNIENKIIGYNYYILTNIYNQKREKLYEEEIFNEQIINEETKLYYTYEIGKKPTYEDKIEILPNIPNYVIGEMKSIDMIEERKIVGEINKDITEFGLGNPVNLDSGERIYWYDKEGKLRWIKKSDINSIRDNELKKELKERIQKNKQRTLTFNKSKYKIKEYPYMNLHFVITIPYINGNEDYVPIYYRKDLIMLTEFLTLIYQISLINGEQLLQLPKIVADDKGDIDFIPNENLPGLESMEEFKVREYQGQIYDEQIYQYQDTFREEQKMEEIPINPLEGFEDLMPKNQQIKPNILPPLEDIMDEEIFK